MWEKLNFHPVQYKVWTCPKRFVYIPAGRQSGKTELALRRLVRYLPIKKEWEDPRYFYAGPTYNQAKRTAWERIKKLIPKQWISDVSESSLTIRTIFGSELFIFGLDKPQRIEGISCDGGVIDECSDIRPGTFDLSILPTLVWRDGWVWFIGIPKRFGVGALEYKSKYFKALKGELENSTAFTWKSSDVVPQDYLELCRKIMDERDFDEQFNASWITASGGVFYSFDEEYNVRPCIYDPSLPILVSSDFNVDPMCWILAHRSGDNLNVFGEIFLRNTNTEETINELLKRYGRHTGGFQFYGDASSRARKTSASMSDYIQISNNPEIKKLGRTMHYTTANPPIADRFAATNARIKDGEGIRHIFIDEKCKNLIRDLLSRTYKPGTRETDDYGDQGHMTDALGYVCYKLWSVNKLQIPISNIVTIRR